MKKTKLSTIRSVFFPSNFEEKYKYLANNGSDFYGDLFEIVCPIILTMDYEAKPKWCPRWFLRLLHEYSNSNLKDKLTKGIRYNNVTLGSYHSLQISIEGPQYIHDLVVAIENSFYIREYRLDLIDQIKKLDPESKVRWENLDMLEDILKKLRKEKSLNKYTDLPK